jgi:nitrite reductase (NADH) large subunit
MTHRHRLAIVGNGMAAAALLELLVRRRTDWHIALFGEEPHTAYDRTALSGLLTGERSREDLRLHERALYLRSDVELHLGCRVEALDVERRVLRTAAGETAFDRCVLATGSLPVVPPIPGADLDGVTTFRTLDDARRLITISRRTRAVVIGGGLLGLEAAHGLMARGLDVTLVHLMDRLMERQLDLGAGSFLRDELRRTGMRIVLPAVTERIEGRGHVEEVVLADGTRLPADLVVICAGIRPNADLAAAAGIEVGHGVLVDDRMETSAPGIFSVGECAEHRGVTHGLLAPVLEQARALARVLAGDRAASFNPATSTALLRAAGVDVFAGGRVTPEPGEHEVIVRDDTLGSYKRLVLRGDLVVGAALVGDLSAMPATADALARGVAVVDRLALLGVGVDDAARMAVPPEAIVCGCGGVTAAAISAAVRDGCTTRESLGRRTGAATACGSCAPIIDALLRVPPSGPDGPPPPQGGRG